MRKYIAVILMISILSIPSYFALTNEYFGHPNGINYTTNKETENFSTLQFYFDGYIQITPSYNHQGNHALQGRFTYTLPFKEPVRYYTDLASNSSTPGILTRSTRVYDDYFESVIKTEFNYFFTWVPPGTSVNSLENNQ